MGTDREMDADRVEQRGCEGAGQARDRQTEGDWEQAWREDAGMIVEREQNSQPDALIFDILDKNEDIGSERNCFLRKRLGMTAMWCFCRKVLPVKNEFLRQEVLLLDAALLEVAVKSVKELCGDLRG
mgnify:CR=1 FL=1